MLEAKNNDELPAIPGFRELWGRGVFHCPYCHGYELNQGAIGVLAAVQAGLMWWFVQKPVERALYLSAFGVPFYVSGMMVSA